MRRQDYDPEYHMPAKKVEFAAAVFPENADTKETDFQGREFEKSKGVKTEEPYPRRRRKNFLTVGAVVVTAVALESANGYDLLGLDIFNSSAYGYSEPYVEPDIPEDEEPEEVLIRPSKEKEPEPSENVPSESTVSRVDEPQDEGEYVEKADKAFPKLPNLETNGWVIASQQYEEYISIFSRDDWNRAYTYSHDGVADIPEEYQLKGISYDKKTNTLTLENVKLSDFQMAVNYMGNGFKVRLIGENELQKIVAYGWGYGGSITFTGDGSLVLNEDLQEDCGIWVNAEWSETCIMIEPGVRLESYGTFSPAVTIVNTSAEKGIYYLEPMSMSGGIRSEGIPIYDFTDRAAEYYSYEKGVDVNSLSEKQIEEESSKFHDFVLLEDGENATHVIFE